MLRDTRLFLLLLALAALAAVGWGSRAQGSSRVTWEYRVVSSQAQHTTTPDKLRELGAEGWELVSVLETEERIGNLVNARREYYLKRAR